MKGVLAVERSENSKLGDVSATYVSRESCPKGCKLWDYCYATKGPTSWTLSKLERRRRGATPAQLATEEARLIDGLTGERPLRLHVVGDVKDAAAARKIAAAADRFSARNGKRVWTYTHSWAKVLRRAWGKVSVLASCDKRKELHKAEARGYVPALVATHQSKKAWKEGVRTFVPCPEQTGAAKSCEQCKLCMNEKILRGQRIVIVFQPHSGLQKVAPWNS